MSIGTASFDNNYRPAGAGANLAQILGSVEDKVFHEDADYTLFKQDQVKYTPHQSAVIVQGVANAGAGKTMVSVLTKTPDLLGNSYTMSSWLGIMGNCECGVTKTSYVNGRALYINKSSSIKIATQTLFTTDGHAQMIVMELMGVMDDYADMVGLCYTKEQLIENSKWDIILYAPWFALYPGQNREDLTFAIGTIAFHPVTYEQTNRGIHELVVNYDGISHRGRGLVALPIEINTGAVVSSSTVDFALANTYIWLSCEERLSLLNGYNETMFKEFIRVGEHSEGPSCNEKKVTFEVNIKGPTTYVWLTVQSRADIENGNWTKTFDDFGLDYITEFMLLTGNTPREDGLPASFYRTAKVMETFHVSIRRAVYVLSFEANDTAKQFTGHQTMTNFERINVQCLVKAHKCTLEFIAYAAVINGVYTERGGGGKIWG